MKYGPIICDPNSEEAKKLVGKKVVGGWSFTALNTKPEAYYPDELLRIEDSCNPFVVDDTNFAFIREVIEEKPTYRPYEDTEEMVEDFKKRFMHKEVHPAFMPLIWLKNKRNEDRELISYFGTVSVYLVNDFYDPKDVFDRYTYLDGSPVGKEVKE